ncbi:MAG TPA: hypothetical protein VKT49_12810 [Bryobacteraceae bacterium]|nr:hypothetical protein [Bryobacteraceae bacterium]
MRTAIWCLLLVAPLCAQRDFLNADEIDQIKEAQDPALRLKLYAKFAKQRVELVQNVFGKDKPGRSLQMHDALEDYSKILDAIDDVTDDALLRKLEVKPGLEEVVAAEKQALPILQKIQNSQPRDLSRYDFALKQAIDTTQDSLEASQSDLGKRGRDVEAREAREKKELEQLGAQTVPDAKKAEEQKKADSDPQQQQQAPKRRAPTLKRPGEQ